MRFTKSEVPCLGVFVDSMTAQNWIFLPTSLVSVTLGFRNPVRTCDLFPERKRKIVETVL